MFLVPMDVNFVSQISLEGVRSQWATPTKVAQWRAGFETACYIAFSLNFFFLFIVLPWTYWYLDDESDSNRPVFNTTALLAILVLMLLLGGLIHNPNPAKLTYPWFIGLMRMMGACN
jgi:hypothetical protein